MHTYTLCSRASMLRRAGNPKRRMIACRQEAVYTISMSNMSGYMAAGQADKIMSSRPPHHVVSLTRPPAIYICC